MNHLSKPCRSSIRDRDLKPSEIKLLIKSETTGSDVILSSSDSFFYLVFENKSILLFFFQIIMQLNDLEEEDEEFRNFLKEVDISSFLNS
jgi:hypothetical protein